MHWTQDFRYALRMMAKRPGFTAVAALSLALGIGANTAIFTVINAVFLHPLPIEEPSRVADVSTLDIRTVTTAGFRTIGGLSLPNYEDYRDKNHVFSGLAAFSGAGLALTGKGEPEQLPGFIVSGNYFDVLGVKAYRGRTFVPDEDNKPGASPVVVLSHSLWVKRFGGDENLIGQTITLQGLPFTVIGVAAPGFKGTFTLARPDILWVPLSMRDQVLTGFIRANAMSRRFLWLGAVGRLRPGITIAQGEAEMKNIAAGLEKEYPIDNQGRSIALTPIREAALGINQRGQFVLAGTVLMTVVGVVLLIACVNLANLMLAQSSARQKEISIRSALGASRGRLVRQLLTESIVLALAGGALGVLVAYWGREALWSYRPPFLNAQAIELHFDPRVLGFTAGISLLTGLLFGLAPAIKISRSNLNDMLKVGGRTGSHDASHHRVQSILVVSEVTLAMVALIAAGLFVRSLQAAQKIELGFESKNLAILNINPGALRYTAPKGQQLYRDIIQRVTSLPSVKAAAVSSTGPLAPNILRTVFPEGKQADPKYRGTLILISDISPGYFDALRVPLLRGREFNEFDRDDSKPVAIISEAMARQLWPGEEALGKRFSFIQGPTMYEIVGIAANTVTRAIGEDPQPLVYRPLWQEYAPGTVLQVRTQGNPESILGSVRGEIRQAEPNLPITNVQTIGQVVEQGLWAPRMGAALLSLFAVLALVLAMIGIYGVMSYSVAQRTQEIGIRMALGASVGDVLGLVLRQGFRLALAGAGLGIVIALALARTVGGLLYGIGAGDPLTYVAVTLLLAAIALAACYIPARRAALVNPIIALRYD